MADSRLPPLLSAVEVSCLFKVSPRTLKRAVDLGTFPPPIELPGTGRSGSRRIAWRGEDVLTYLDSLKPVSVAMRGGDSNV